MKSRSGLKQWLFTGLALLGSTGAVYGQAVSPYHAGASYGGAPAGMAYPGGNMPGPMSNLGNHGPMSIAMPGPPPGEVNYAAGPGPIGGPMGAVIPASAIAPGCACCEGACDVGAAYGGCDGMCSGGGGLCADCGGTGCLFCDGVGCDACGGQRGCSVCGSYGGRLGCAPIRNLFRSTGIGRGRLGTDGCMACGWGNNALCPGALTGLLGRFAPYAEGPQSQRWFDAHIGTMALKRTDDITGNGVIATQGIAGNPVLRLNSAPLDDLQFGLLTTFCLQTGVGSNLELTYFGLNKWTNTATATGPGDLFSVISNFGQNPPGGFGDTDGSFIQSVTYKSAIHNGELSFRRRLVAPQRWVQGSWLAGIRYFDLDEKFQYQAVGANGLVPKFFNLDTRASNQLTGFQIGSDGWLTIVPGWMVGVEGKTGVYGNHMEVTRTMLSNSVAFDRERRSAGETAYLTDLALNTIYRVSYSWSFRASYNYMRVANVALAPRNFNTTNIGAAGLAFGGRIPTIDVDGVAKYSGFTLGAEYMW